MAGEVVIENVVRGQYSAGAINGKPVVGYREEQEVNPKSTIETYVALRLRIDDWRWADVPVYLEGVGSVKALNMATVRAQVDGRLLSVNFKEGEDVKKGDVLAKIDPVTYQAQLDQAIAGVEVRKAEAEAERKLFGSC